jgi:GT2 family glycosyltransferase
MRVHSFRSNVGENSMRTLRSLEVRDDFRWYPRLMTLSTLIDVDVKIRVVVLMACHNRAQRTSAFFDSFKSASKHGFVFEFIVTDDGSIDETSTILESQPEVIKVLSGDGQLFWARAMRMAEDAMEDSYDAILWINDDIVLMPNAFEKLLEARMAFSNSVLVGQIARAEDDEILYGGYLRLGVHPLRLRRLSSRENYQAADTFNGNFVYIPTEVHSTVGLIDPVFRHGYADCDYGYRVCKAGYSIKIIPGIVAYGLENSDSWPESRLGKMRKLASVKYSPLKSQLHFFRKHTGSNWLILTPIFTAYPFLRILVFNKLKDEIATNDPQI